MVNYDLMSDNQSTPAGIPNIIFTGIVSQTNHLAR